MVRRKFIRSVFGLCIATSLASCGTYVPDIYEIGGEAGDGELLAASILRKVKCDINDAFAFIFKQDEQQAKLNNGPLLASYLTEWGVLGALTITIKERTAVSPSLLGIFPNAGPITLGGRVNASSEAYRVNTIQFYERIDFIKEQGPCLNTTEELVITDRSFLIKSDLKLREVLSAQVLGTSLGAVRIPQNETTSVAKKSITHSVKFTIEKDASVSALSVINLISLGSLSFPLASVERDNVHEILLTIGPAGPKDQLQPQATAGFTSELIGAAVSRNIRER